MVKELNQGPYKGSEMILGNFLKKMPDGMSVHLNIIINEGIPLQNANNSMPANFRLVWCSSDGNTFYRSPLYENDSERVQTLRGLDRHNRDEFLHGEHFNKRLEEQDRRGNYPAPSLTPIIKATRVEVPVEIVNGIEVIPRPGVAVINLEFKSFPETQLDMGNFRGEVLPSRQAPFGETETRRVQPPLEDEDEDEERRAQQQ
jgi:hypothetical protein